MIVEDVRWYSATGATSALRPVAVDGDWPQVHDRICREIAQGRIVACLRERPSHWIPWATRVSVVERPDGSAFVVFDQGGKLLTPYEADSVEAARQAARAVLASGVAFNW